jgi:hypothetical protein
MPSPEYRRIRRQSVLERQRLAEAFISGDGALSSKCPSTEGKAASAGAVVRWDLQGSAS